MNTRLQQFLAAENITQAQFADSIGVAAAGVSHIISGRNKPGYDFILNTMNRYPDLNIEWLLNGKGKMYRSAPIEVPKHDSPATDDNLFSIPQDEDLFSVSGNEISAPQPMLSANNEISESPDSPVSPVKSTETPVKQRKAVKIIVFYDDNTFQEF